MARQSIVVPSPARARGLENRRWLLGWTESNIAWLSVFNVSKPLSASGASLAPAISRSDFSDPTPFEIRPAVDPQNTALAAWKELIGRSSSRPRPATGFRGW